MQESGGRLRSDEMVKNDSAVWGWIDVTKMEFEGVDLLSESQFIHPDDDNENDHHLSVPSIFIVGTNQTRILLVRSDK